MKLNVICKGIVAISAAATAVAGLAGPTQVFAARVAPAPGILQPHSSHGPVESVGDMLKTLSIDSQVRLPRGLTLR
ncbi:MAG: hypothetical protein ACYDGR_01310 [Candidatus Dormibacteria bacterium]